jgi:RimJ/RimL family protein N-acetyltransferase
MREGLSGAMKGLPAPSDEALGGRRIRLVALAEADVVPLHEWFLQSDPARLTCRPFAKRTPEELVRRFRERRDSESQRVYAIRRRDDGQLLGRVSWFDRNPRNRTVEIGFLVGPEFRGRGYGREAVGALLGELFGRLKVNKVLAQCGAFNGAAIALLKSLGFEQCGRLRSHHLLGEILHDDLLFDLLAEEFSAVESSIPQPRKEPSYG